MRTLSIDPVDDILFGTGSSNSTIDVSSHKVKLLTPGVYFTHRRKTTQRSIINYKCCNTAVWWCSSGTVFSRASRNHHPSSWNFKSLLPPACPIYREAIMMNAKHGQIVMERKARTNGDGQNCRDHQSMRSNHQ